MTLIGRLARIFERYADGRLVLTRPGGVLRRGDGSVHGRVDRLVVNRGRLRAEGWSSADRIGLQLGTSTAWTVPATARPGSDERAFALDVPFLPGPVTLLAERDGTTHATALPGFSGPWVALRRKLLWGAYLADIARLAPEIWQWKRHGDLGAREVVKERLHLVPATHAVDLDRDAVLGPPAAPHPAPAATLILPVYNAFDLLPEMLDRLARHSDGDWHLVAIEDASPDGRVRPFLRDWAAAHRGRVTLLENDTNLGFIGSVNRGLDHARAHAPDRPVVLVNADALVPEGWLSRLLAPLADPRVASVTPMSNDAEIFTVPVICARHALRPGLADALDAAARDLPARAQVTAPTGVGFCMALAPRFLALHPRLDTAFGRGYGEETDWCQKARAAGGVHVAAPNLFVEHRGGESFGQAAKQALLERNGAEISRRYPSYDAEVQEFLRSDPLVTSRLALGLSWAALAQPEGRPVPVCLAHAMGGGAETWLQARIAREIDRGGSAVVLRVGQGRRWRLELRCAHGVTQGVTDDWDLVQSLIARLPDRRIVYSCGVGDREAQALPDRLLTLAGNGAHPVEVLFHDFFPVSPSYTLLDHAGHWRGVPLPGTPAGESPAHVHEARGGLRTGLAEWQAAWGRLIAAADRVTVFSENSRRIVETVWPEAAPRIAVRPHPLPAPPPRIAPGWDGRGTPTVAVLGNIGVQKGAAVLQRLSRDLARDGRLRLAVIGHLDPDYALAPPAIVHGSYELRDLPGLVARYGIAGWLIPSVWPETFSFTTHEALATGLPVIAFDLGAQGDAVARAVAQGAPGAVLPMPVPPALDVDALVTILHASPARPDPEPA